MMIGMFFFVTTMKQCGMKKDIEKNFDERVELFKVWEDNLHDSYSDELAVMHDSVEYYRSLLELNQEKVKQSKVRLAVLQSEYDDLEPKMEQIPMDASGAFVTGLYEPKDTMQYPLSGNQVSEIHLDLLEGIKAEEIIKELQFENHYLDESLLACGDMAYQISKENELLEGVVKEKQLQLLDAKLNEKKLKKKLWANRGLAGGAAVIAILILL